MSRYDNYHHSRESRGSRQDKVGYKVPRPDYDRRPLSSDDYSSGNYYRTKSKARSSRNRSPSRSSSYDDKYKKRSSRSGSKQTKYGKRSSSYDGKNKRDSYHYDARRRSPPPPRSADFEDRYGSSHRRSRYDDRNRSSRQGSNYHDKDYDDDGSYKNYRHDERNRSSQKDPRYGPSPPRHHYDYDRYGSPRKRSYSPPRHPYDERYGAMDHDPDYNHDPHYREGNPLQRSGSSANSPLSHPPSGAVVTRQPSNGPRGSEGQHASLQQELEGNEVLQAALATLLLRVGEIHTKSTLREVFEVVSQEPYVRSVEVQEAFGIINVEVAKALGGKDVAQLPVQLDTLQGGGGGDPDKVTMTEKLSNFMQSETGQALKDKVVENLQDKAKEEALNAAADVLTGEDPAEAAKGFVSSFFCCCG